MTLKRLILPIAIITLLMLALYWLIASRLLLDPPDTPSSPATSTNSAEVVKTEIEPVVTSAVEPATKAAGISEDSGRQGGSKLVEIFGRVLDRNCNLSTRYSLPKNAISSIPAVTRRATTGSQ